mmetsp:Transcript_544/g.1601  ORF Transcript_544/g.1601 Transcript_544/m.1601 type:complete len:201 (+) Transcript_544:253-855(+)
MGCSAKKACGGKGGRLAAAAGGGGGLGRRRATVRAKGSTLRLSRSWTASRLWRLSQSKAALKASSWPRVTQSAGPWLARKRRRVASSLMRAAPSAGSKTPARGAKRSRRVVAAARGRGATRRARPSGKRARERMWRGASRRRRVLRAAASMRRARTWFLRKGARGRSGEARTASSAPAEASGRRRRANSRQVARVVLGQA